MKESRDCWICGEAGYDYAEFNTMLFPARISVHACKTCIEKAVAKALADKLATQ